MPSLRLGLTSGYSRGTMMVDRDLILEAERLGFHSVWSAEAYGSDAVTPLAWIAAFTSKIKLGTAIMQMPGAHAGDDRDDGDDARCSSPAGASCSASAPPGRRSSKAGTACLRQAARAHARVRRDRARILAREAPLEHQGRALPDSLPRPGRDRARQAAEEHPARPQTCRSTPPRSDRRASSSRRRSPTAGCRCG